MAVGALNTESQCSRATVPDWLVRFSWGEYCGSWVTFAWRMALSMVRDSVRGLPCQIGSCASLGENTVAVWLRSCGVWRSLLLTDSVLGGRAELLQLVEIP